MHPWDPVFQAMSAAAKNPPPRRVASTGQVEAAFPESPRDPLAFASQAVQERIQERIQERTQDLLGEFREGFRQITPALILTGIAIGIASGLGSTVGTAVGTYFVGRFTKRSGAKK